MSRLIALTKRRLALARSQSRRDEAGRLVITLPPLHAGQQYVHESRARYRVLACGRRWGKTVYGIRALAEQAAQGQPCAYFVPTYPMLSEVWRELSFRLAPAAVRISKQERRIEMPGGGGIDCWSLENPDSCRGRKYARVVLDEAAYVRGLRDAWERSIRPTLTDLRGGALFLSTPRGRDDFYEFWRRGGDSEEPDWASWQVPTGSNPHIPPEEIEAARRELPGQVFSQEYLAEFLEVGGRFFADFREAWHVVEARAVPSWWQWFAGLDYGVQAPFALVLCAVDEAGRVWVADEVVESRLSPSAQADKVLECLRRNGAPEHTIIACDPSVFPPSDASKRVGRYVVEDYWAAGLRVIPAQNDRIPGWGVVRSWLHRADDDDGPMLRLMRGRAPITVRQLATAISHERKVEDIDTEQQDGATGHWDAIDALRYAMMYHASPSEEPKGPQLYDKYLSPLIHEGRRV